MNMMTKRKKIQLFMNKSYVKIIVQLLAIIVGCFIMGVGYRAFYLPNNITPGGFSGIATIISFLLAKANIIISPSIIYLAINIILFIVALKMFGLRFALYTLVGILAFTLAMEYAVISALISHDLLLSAIMGGALTGVGIGIVFRFGGSTGGGDILAFAINKYFPKIKTGQCTFIINAMVILVSVFVYGVNLSLYAIIGIFIASKLTDTMLDGTKSVRAFYIICDKDEQIANKILDTFHRGVTSVNVEGVFSRKEKKMLMCLVTNQQAPIMKSIIKDIDKNAFVFSTSVKETLGESFFLKEVSIKKHKMLDATAICKSNKKLRRSSQKISKRNKFRPKNEPKYLAIANSDISHLEEKSKTSNNI